MLISRDIQVVHLEPTDVCQAACPQCARETDQFFDKTQRHNLSVEQIDEILPLSITENLSKMFMCGNYGDPAAGKYTLELYRYFRKHNPNIVLGMNTNGALASEEWWKELAAILGQPLDYVIFSIDGLEDTNHKYRINVDWHKLMKNASAFISAGGSAHWDMLVYQHNQHQVQQCETLARQMGFRWFRTKVTRRPMIPILSLPLGWTQEKHQITNIDCHALRERSIYIDAQGRVSPCCWLGSRQQDFVQDFDLIQQTWSTNDPNPTCLNTCGKSKNGTMFSNQWQQEKQL
jgi:hypothetical protein